MYEIGLLAQKAFIDKMLHKMIRSFRNLKFIVKIEKLDFDLTL